MLGRNQRVLLITLTSWRRVLGVQMGELSCSDDQVLGGVEVVVLCVWYFCFWKVYLCLREVCFGGNFCCVITLCLLWCWWCWKTNMALSWWWWRSCTITTGLRHRVRARLLAFFACITNRSLAIPTNYFSVITTPKQWPSRWV